MRIRKTLQGSSIAPWLLGAVSSIQQDRMAASHDALGPAEWLADVIGYFGLVIEATTRSVLIGPTVEHGPERAKKRPREPCNRGNKKYFKLHLVNGTG